MLARYMYVFCVINTQGKSSSVQEGQYHCGQFLIQRMATTCTRQFHVFFHSFPCTYLCKLIDCKDVKCKKTEQCMEC